MATVDADNQRSTCRNSSTPLSLLTFTAPKSASRNTTSASAHLNTIASDNTSTFSPIAKPRDFFLSAIAVLSTRGGGNGGIASVSLKSVISPWKPGGVENLNVIQSYSVPTDWTFVTMPSNLAMNKCYVALLERAKLIAFSSALGRARRLDDLILGSRPWKLF